MRAGWSGATQRLALLAAFVVGACGCELIVTVDRSEIDRAEASADAGAGGQCTSEDQCPVPEDECLEAKCTQGRCATAVAKGATCSDGVCDAKGRCVAPGCVNNVKDGLETDIDCGGPLCPACKAFMGCKENSDCESGICDQLSMSCGG